jgi:hypothetical protein
MVRIGSRSRSFAVAIPKGVYKLFAQVRALSYLEEMKPRGYLSAKLVESNNITVNLQ